MFSSHRRRGFTLLELIVVVVVLGIIAAFTVPTFNSVKTNIAESVATRNAESVVRDAVALASLDSASLNNTYLDLAGSESVGYNSDANAVTVPFGSKTIMAMINDSTGAITLSQTAGAVVVSSSYVHHVRDCRYQWSCNGPNGPEPYLNLNRPIITTMGDVWEWDTLETTYTCPNGGSPDPTNSWCVL